MVVAAILLGQHASAQTLSLSLLERYLESLRVEAGIPGMSVAVLQDGRIVWERGFGRQDVEGGVSATPSTPYVLGDLSQTIGATLLLKKCVEEGTAELSHPLAWWAPQVPDASTTIRDILAHTAPGIGFRYDGQRFAWLTGAVERCAERPYVQVVVEEVFERLGMAHSVPGHAIAGFTPREAAALGPGRLGHYAGVLGHLAVPYRVDSRDASVARTPVIPIAADAATGLVSTVQDLARFDAALDDSGVLLLPETRRIAWTRVWPQPTGLGWFVQGYNGEPVVWQFGLVRNAYSSLVLKVPNRRLTVIALANSDGLSAPFALEQGDVTTSIFARLFLRLLVV